jgi:hypothetical protein
MGHYTCTSTVVDLGWIVDLQFPRNHLCLQSAGVVKYFLDGIQWVRVWWLIRLFWKSMKNDFKLHHNWCQYERQLVAQTTVVLCKVRGLTEIFFKLWT